MRYSVRDPSMFLSFPKITSCLQQPLEFQPSGGGKNGTPTPFVLLRTLQPTFHWPDLVDGHREALIWSLYFQWSYVSLKTRDSITMEEGKNRYWGTTGSLTPC